MKIVGFRFGFCTGRFLYLSTEQYGVFIVRVLGEYGVDVFHSLFVLLHLRQSLGTQQTGFGEVVLEYDGFCEVGDAHDAIVLAVVGFSQQIVRHGIAFFNGNGFFGGFRHGGIVLLHVADVGKGE